MGIRRSQFAAFVVWHDPENRGLAKTAPGPTPGNEKRSEGFASIKKARGFKHYLGKAFGIKAKLIVNP